MPVSFYDRILVLRRIPNREYSGFEGEREKENREGRGKKKGFFFFPNNFLLVSFAYSPG